MRINHNISAMITQGALSSVSREMSKSLAKLSTGLRINSAADDAAGLGVSENLRTQVTGMGQALKNTQDAVSMLNIADGALNEQANILQRMRELVIQAMNDTYSSVERSYMGQEFVALRDELDRIAAVTNFNTMKIFAAPAETQASGNPVYDADSTGQPPRQTIIAGSIDPSDPLFGAIDNTSGNHFNMMVGANASAEDVAAFNTTFNSYGKSAANMITIQFGQMDANGLLSINPSGATAKTVFDGFTWNEDLMGGGGDTEDNNIAMGAIADGDAADPTETSIRTKLKLLLEIIDGSRDVGAGMQAMVFAPPTTGEFKTGLARINEMRARIGAMTNRLEHSINNTINQVNNMQSAESLVRDADFAEETAKFTKNQILTQSATAMLAQANSQPKTILSLLK
jgi:flagellin